jgi:CotH kinase protein/Lamin Tail Domain
MRAVSSLGVGVLLLFAGICAAAPLASADVVLNEINCEGTDWVELVNVSDAPADISGWRLSDRPLDSTDDTHRMFFPADTVIAPNDDLVVEKGTGGYPLFPFGISCGDDTLRLGDASGAPVDDEVVPSLLSGADTWGRYPNGTGTWTETIPTKGAPNEPSTTSGDPTDDLAAWLYDPTQVVGIDLELSPESIEALNADPDTYVDGQFSLTAPGASYGPLAVGIRLKGNATFRPLTGKAAFKVKFSQSVPGQRFLGMKHLTLNNMLEDPSSVHEVLAYDAFRAMGIPASRTGYADVRVNDDEFGLYLNIETMDDIALRRWFETTQHLYEGSFGADVLPGEETSFEVDEGNEADLGDLQNLIGAVGTSWPADWSDQVAPLADLSEMTKMWAVEKYVSHWDGYSGPDGIYWPNNYFLHSDDSGLFTMLPWGTDQTFSDHISFDGSAGTLFDHCLADSSCAAAYKDAVLQTRETLAGLDLDGQVTALATELAPWQASNSRDEYSGQDIADAVASTRDFIATRPADVDDWIRSLESGPPADQPSPQPLGVSAKKKTKRCKKRPARAAAAKCRKPKHRN